MISDKTDAFRILSIDGGGIRGILPARVLQYIEEKLNKPASEIFHLIAGTSTGGIIGCGLLVGKKAKDLGDLYAGRGSDIFAHSLWHTISVRPETIRWISITYPLFLHKRESKDPALQRLS